MVIIWKMLFSSCSVADTLFLKNEIWKYRLPCRDQALLSATPEAMGRAHSSCSTPDYWQHTCRMSCLPDNTWQHPSCSLFAWSTLLVPNLTDAVGCLDLLILSLSCAFPHSATVWNKKDAAPKDLVHPNSHDLIFLHLLVLPLDGSLDLQSYSVKFLTIQLHTGAA